MGDKKFASLTLRIPSDIHRSARLKSVMTGRSLNAIVTQKLQEWVNETPKARETDKKAVPHNVR